MTKILFGLAAFVVLWVIADKRCTHPDKYVKLVIKTKHGALYECTRCGKTWTE